MEFEEENVPTFLDNFESIKLKIRNYPGCLFLELWQDRTDASVFFTHSRWQTETDLQNYRSSALFKSVWATTKPLFRSRATAWSVDSVEVVE